MRFLVSLEISGVSGEWGDAVEGGGFGDDVEL